MVNEASTGPTEQAKMKPDNSDSVGISLLSQDFKVCETSVIRVQLKQWDSKKHVDLRSWGLSNKGTWYPRKNGVWFEYNIFKNEMLPFFVSL